MADLYAAITDDTVNRIINLLHARVPFLFNYVAPSVRLRTNEAGQLMGFEELWLTCSEVVPVPPPGVPRYRRIPSFELPGIAVKLPCSIQLIDLNFIPSSDTVTMPSTVASTGQPTLRDSGDDPIRLGLCSAECSEHAQASNLHPRHSITATGSAG